MNEYNQPILDAPDFQLQLQISIFDQYYNYLKEAKLQGLKLLSGIFFVLKFFNFLIKNKYYYHGGNLQTRVYGSRKGRTSVSKRMGQSTNAPIK